MVLLLLSGFRVDVEFPFQSCFCSSIICQVHRRFINCCCRFIFLFFISWVITDVDCLTQQAALVLNACRRFRYTLDLKKDEEKEQRRRMIRSHAHVIRVIFLKSASISSCIRGCLISWLTVICCFRQHYSFGWEGNNRLVCCSLILFSLFSFTAQNLTCSQMSFVVVLDFF